MVLHSLNWSYHCPTIFEMNIKLFLSTIICYATMLQTDLILVSRNDIAKNIVFIVAIVYSAPDKE